VKPARRSRFGSSRNIVDSLKLERPEKEQEHQKAKH
jgi:hypothetical protein